MKNSGQIYNYKNNFTNKKIIRRYPTGALSEKVALILPSMLSAIADEYPIISTFLVAKSLSFTGGTWDKLNVLQGFVFPNPGDETLEVLKKCNVAMTVTKDDLCPADRILYQIRSLTGTVNSIPLAVASIASKQLACPADLLLLDVRFGEGAFFKQGEAKRLKKLINTILKQEGFDIINSFIKMDQPNGIGIGNYLELCEAICIIKDEYSLMWDIRAINEQKNIVIKFFARIMNYFFPKFSIKEWKTIGNNLFLEGKVIKAFENLLIAHSAPLNIVNPLIKDPFKHFNLTKIVEVKSMKKGTLNKIDQKRIGNITNFGFNFSATSIQIEKVMKLWK